jgi:ParB family chromosome partitioning protein
MIAAVPLSLVNHGTRLRKIDEGRVEMLKRSMLEVGLLNPITVYACDVMRGNGLVKGYGIVAGSHRLDAAQSLGWETIAATVCDLSDLHRQLAECDENLCGTMLSPAERAKFTSRRKDVYEALHPETRHGAVGRNHPVQSCQNDDSEPVSRFTADTAAKTGKSEASIQRDARRGEKITDEAMAEIVGTDLDKGTVLDAIAREPNAAAQLAAIKREQNAVDARKANREADKIIDEASIEVAAEFLHARLDINEMAEYGKMIMGICPVLAKAIMRRVA